MKFRFAQCTQLATSQKVVRVATMNLSRITEIKYERAVWSMDVHVLEILSHVGKLNPTERDGSECHGGDVPSTLLLSIDSIGAPFCLRIGNWL